MTLADNQSMNRKNIPWDFKKLTATQRIWAWQTKHFDAQIRNDEGTKQYLIFILDLTTGKPESVMNALEITFDEAEYAVIDFISKSYPRDYGYREYAGHIATTFKIGSGQALDFGLLEGQTVGLDVMTSEGTRSVEGNLTVVNHSIQIRQKDGLTATIPPRSINGIHGDAYARLKEKLYPRSAAERTVTGTASPGCTGIVGFKPKTVIHDADVAFCPIHRV